MFKRLIKGLRNIQRIVEVGKCRRMTPQWMKLTVCYIGWPALLPFEIQLGQGPCRFETVADVRTFWLIFFGETYPVRRTDRMIVDGGANVGFFTLYALLTAPNARVVAVEPAPDSCARTRRLIRDHGLEDRVTLYEAALGSHSGTTTLDMKAGSQFRTTGSGGVEVRMLTLDEIVTGTVDILKLDVEGAEYQTLAAASTETLRRIQRIAMEYHPNGTLFDFTLPRAGLVLESARDDGGGYGMAYLGRNSRLPQQPPGNAPARTRLRTS